MTTENKKTSIKGTPYFLGLSEDPFVDDNRMDRYEVEGITIPVADNVGELSISIIGSEIHVSGHFGSEGWARVTDTPVMIDGVRHSVSVRFPGMPFTDFDLAAVHASEPTFTVRNLDVRSEGLVGMFGTTVPEDAPLAVSLRAVFVPAVRDVVQDIATRHPDFGVAFREAVHVSEIARLRDLQLGAWNDMIERMDEIRRLMKQVPDEARLLPPEPGWEIPAEEAARFEIAFESTPARSTATGVAKFQINNSVLGAFVTVDLLDGTFHTDHIVNDDDGVVTSEAAV